VKESITEKLIEKRTANTAGSSRDNNTSRGDQMLELVRQTSLANLDV